MLATNAQDTRAAAPWLKTLTAPDTTVAVLQNDIGHEERVRPFVGHAPVVPTLVYAAVERLAPGRIVYHAGNLTIVANNQHGATFARLLAGSGQDVVQEADFNTAAWRKLLSNVAANPITALTLRRIGIMGKPEIRELARGLLGETVASGKAAGARLTDRDVDGVLSLYASFSESGGSSMLYDRLAGRPMEHAYLTGAVVRTADRHGVAVPLNRAILALIEALDEGIQAGTGHD